MTPPNFNDKHLPLIAHLADSTFEFNLAQWLASASRTDVEMASSILLYAHQQGAQDPWLQAEGQRAQVEYRQKAAYTEGNRLASQLNPIEVRVKGQALCQQLNPFDAKQALPEHMAWQDGFLDWIESQLGESW